MPMHVAPYVTRAKEFNNQKLSFPANSSHRFSHGHSLDVFLLWQYVFLHHSHLLESKLPTNILPASCVGMVHVTTRRVKRLANPHNTTHQGTTKTWWVSSRMKHFQPAALFTTQKSLLSKIHSHVCSTIYDSWIFIHHESNLVSFVMLLFHDALRSGPTSAVQQLESCCWNMCKMWFGGIRPLPENKSSQFGSLKPAGYKRWGK